MKDDLPFLLWFGILCIASAFAAFMAITLTIGVPVHEYLA